MKAASGHRKTRGSDIAIGVVAIISLVSTFALNGSDLGWGGMAFVGLLIVLYSALAIWGVEYCEKSDGLLGNRVVYLLVQVALGELVFYFSQGGAWLILAPVASQAVYLFRRRGALLANGLIFVASMAVVRLLTTDPLTLLQSGMALLAALVFVMVFSEIAMREEKARFEVERLAAELGEANLKLRQYAIGAEELAILQERNRLAREIHDGLGHYLTALNMQVKAAAAVMAQDPSQAQEALAKAQSLAENALADVRRSVAALRDDPALKRPLTESLQALLEEVRSAGLVADFHTQGEARPLPSQVTLTLYRAAQESLTNVRKHALASRVDVTLAYQPGSVCLQVTDNGVGAVSIEGGFGLLGLRERVAILDGNMDISSAHQIGFTMRVTIPLVLK